MRFASGTAFTVHFRPSLPPGEAVCHELEKRMPKPTAPRLRRRDARRVRAAVEAIEPRVLLSTYTVTNLNDSGPGSLRDAIQQANANPGPDTITFKAGIAGIIDINSPLELSDTTGQTTIQGPGDTVVSVERNRFVVDARALTEIRGLNVQSGVQANMGGAILNSGTLAVVACSFAGNQAMEGGDIGNTGTLSVVDSIFGRYDSQFGGQAANAGGGIFSSGALTAAGCTFWYNYAGDGGAIANSGGTLTAANCTFVGNVAETQGGAIFNSDSPTSGGIVELTNCTIFGNSAPSGGGICDNGTTVNLNNSIVAANTTTSAGTPADISGPASGSFDLIGGGGSGGLIDGNSGNRVGLTADQLRLGPLQYYGGPTTTMIPTPGSPAIDAGSNTLAISPDGQPLSVDQRGLSRIAGAAVDIGAAEYQDVPVNTTKDLPPGPGELQDGASLAPGEFSIRTAVNMANVSTGSNAITFDPAVFAPGTLHTVSLQGSLPIDDAVTILGPGPAVLEIRMIAGGDALTIEAGAAAQVRDLTISGGSYGPGRIPGGINNSGRLDARGCVFTNTSAGAIENLAGGAVTVADCTFSNNQNFLGGAILNHGMLTVTDSSFVGNWGPGGAIYNDGSGVVAGCTFSGNSAAAFNPVDADGGAVYNAAGSLAISDSTFVGNSAQYSGGAIENRGALSLVQCTITQNQALGGYGIDTTTAIAMDNSIVSGNYSQIPPGYEIFGSIHGSNNLIGSAFPDGPTNGVDGNIVGVRDPMLARLGNYGGPTQTMPPLLGSPALDAGSNALAVDGSGNPLTTDQRGLPRNSGGIVDIGAAEYQWIAGDVNKDGTVNFADLLVLAQNYGKQDVGWGGGDLDGDGTVGFPDLLMLAQNYGRSQSAAAAVQPLDLINPKTNLKAKHRH